MIPAVVPGIVAGMAGDLGERQGAPAVAAQAVGFEPVAVLEQTGEGAEEDHARVAPTAALVGRQTIRPTVSEFLTCCGTESPVRSPAIR